MVPMTVLWLPILLSSVVVFLASFVMHMVLGYHRKDFSGVPNEEPVLNALRNAGMQPGEYMLPHGGGPEALKDPAFIEKMKRGPVAIITLRKPGPPSMGPYLLAWFVYVIVVEIFAAYVTGRALGPGVEYIHVFRFIGTVGFIGFALALWQNAIWYSRPIRTTILQTIDGLVFALLSAGVFGWLWPR